ncbi:MAG: hypothetical protein NT154_32125 [Verrucomicrobia bacterium]|nr:hypothetical protein [Verrucomicrobiota bacterium]
MFLFPRQDVIRYHVSLRLAALYMCQSPIVGIGLDTLHDRIELATLLVCEGQAAVPAEDGRRD